MKIFNIMILTCLFACSNDPNGIRNFTNLDEEEVAPPSSEETIYETASDTDSTYTPPKKYKKSWRVIEESSESEESVQSNQLLEYEEEFEGSKCF